MMKLPKFILISFLFLFASNIALAQESDSLSVDSVEIHSPKKAMWLSVALPGAGQFYNRKYWKMPIIYVAGAALVYSFVSHNAGYTKFKAAYEQIYYHPNEPLPGFELYSKAQLKDYKDQHRRYRDMSVIGFGLLYVLNIVDATVDGYLFDYDVSDDLTLRIEPVIMNNNYTFSQQFGVKCSFKF